MHVHASLDQFNAHQTCSLADGVTEGELDVRNILVLLALAGGEGEHLYHSVIDTFDAAVSLRVV